jgi:hypothetical protein
MRLTAQPTNRVVSWVVFVGIFFPAIQIDIAGLVWTPGRAVTVMFLMPTVWVVLQRKRIFASDVLVFAVSAWSIASVILNGGFRPYVLVEALELLSGYMIGRAYFNTSSNLQQFIRVLKVISIVLIMLAMLDTMSGRRLTAETVARIFPFRFDESETQVRNGLVRATSTFPVAELYGTFCAIAACIFLYSERTWMRKLLYGSLCILGCVLSVSSGPLLVLSIILFTYSYDMLLRRYTWRWKALRISAGGLLLAIFLGEKLVLGNDLMHPILWVVRNLTFDPWTGYFRVEEWEHAFVTIDAHPLIGIGFNPIADQSDIFLHSLDSLYLVMAWRFGLPAALLLLSAMVASISGSGGADAASREPFLRDMRQGLILTVTSIAIVGLTVHLWDSTWIFWSICMGICASFKNYPRSSRTRIRRAELRPRSVMRLERSARHA